MTSKRSRGKPQTGYISRDDDEANLERLDDAFGQTDEHGKIALFPTMHEEKIRAYFGEPPTVEAYQKAAASSGAFSLGVRGKIWALSLFIARYSDTYFATETQLATTMVDNSVTLLPGTFRKCRDAQTAKDKNESKDNPEAPPGRHFIIRLLKLLISESQKDSCPPANVADDLLHFAVHFCRDRVFCPYPSWHTEDEAKLREIVDAAYSRPSELYKRLVDLLPKGATKRDPSPPRRSPAVASGASPAELQKAKASYVDAVLSRNLSIKPNSTERSDPTVTELLDAISSQKRERERVFILSGPLSSGKKTKLNLFLRTLSDGDCLLLRDKSSNNNPAFPLPICALSAKNKHYRLLVSETVSFLKRYAGLDKAAPTGSSGLPQQFGEWPTLEGLLADVHRLHPSCPALFVFADVDAFHADYDRNAVRDMGITRLLDSLLKSNPNSMAIVTTTARLEPKDASARPFALPGYRVIPVAPPTMSDVRKVYLPGRRKFPALMLLDAPIASDDLHATAALLYLSSQPSEVVSKIAAYTPTSSPSVRNEIVRSVYRDLIAEIEGRGLLAPLALIAASDDGLRDDSLRRLLKAWAPYNDCVSEDLLGPDLVPKLKTFSESAGGRFLLRVTIARYDREEYDFSETHSGHDNVWELDSLLSETLLEVLSVSHEQLVREAYRLIARLARDRAQIKKVMMHSPLGSRASEDASRDIQSFVSLLASIPPGDAEDIGAPIGSLRIHEDKVFSLDPSVFSVKRSLQFAIMCLLQEDIDHDHRLTMVFDEDALRLDLYLRLFHELGQKPSTMKGPLGLPNVLPSHLAAGFVSDDKVLELMSTVALSALHAQRYDVVRAIVPLAEQFCRERSVDNYRTKIIRIWCSDIDTSILKGGRSESPDTRNHLETLACVRELRAEHFGFLDQLLARQIEAPPSEDPETIKAGIRLLAREAELLGLTSVSRDVAEKCYEELERLEEYFAAYFPQHDPVVLSGRVARRYVRFLLKSPVFDLAEDSEGRRSALILKVRQLIGTNISRLRRFSGADRVGVMVDTARLRGACGRPDQAIRWAQEASVRAFSGNVSHAGKLDVLKVNAEFNLQDAEKRIERFKKGTAVEELFEEIRAVEASMDAAETNVRQLRSIAKDVDSLPHAAYSMVFKARHALLRAQVLNLRGDADFDADEALANAAQIMRDAEARLRALHDRSFDIKSSAVGKRIDEQLALRQAETSIQPEQIA